MTAEQTRPAIGREIRDEHLGAPRPDLDAAVAALQAGKDAWARTSVAQRMQILEEIRDAVMTVADGWGETAARSKQIPAGAPIEAFEVEESIDVPAQLVPRRGQCFVLQVRGDSMIDDQICDGDYVVVESRPEARDGETVVALVGGRDATLKRFFRRGGQVRLQPANQSMKPIDVPASEVEVRGVVRGLLRQY